MTGPAGSEPLVDTHCHLVLLEERGLLDEAMASAAANGVTQIVSVGLNVEDSDRNRLIAEAHDNVWFTVGWHPHETQPPDAAQLKALDELLAHPRAVAVGEVGLDLYFRPGYHETPLEVQLRSLHIMLDLAGAHAKPVVVHDRDAHAEVLGACAGHPRTRGLMHCFSGDAAFGAACVAAGFALSFAGVLTFPRSEPIQSAAAGVADDSYVVETDAPFLAPVPHRGRTNLPGYVAATAAAVARLRGVDEAVVRRQTTATARRVLSLPEVG